MKGRQGAIGANQSGAAAAGGGGGASATIRPHQMTPQELHEAQSPQDQFAPDVNENTSESSRGNAINRNKDP